MSFWKAVQASESFICPCWASHFLLNPPVGDSRACPSSYYPHLPPQSKPVTLYNHPSHTSPGEEPRSPCMTRLVDSLIVSPGLTKLCSLPVRSPSILSNLPAVLADIPSCACFPWAKETVEPYHWKGAQTHFSLALKNQKNQKHVLFNVIEMLELLEVK